MKYYADITCSSWNGTRHCVMYAGSMKEAVNQLEIWISGYATGAGGGVGFNIDKVYAGEPEDASELVAYKRLDVLYVDDIKRNEVAQ